MIIPIIINKSDFLLLKFNFFFNKKKEFKIN